MSSVERCCAVPNISTSWTSLEISDLSLVSVSVNRASDIKAAEHVGGGLVELVRPADLLETAQQVVCLNALFVGAAEVVQDRSAMHHHQPVAQRRGLLHRVGHHQRGQPFSRDDVLAE